MRLVLIISIVLLRTSTTKAHNGTINITYKDKKGIPLGSICCYTRNL